MSLTNGKHIIKEIEGTRCTLLEAGISEERMEFLKHLMELNGYEVKVEKEPKKVQKAPPKVIPKEEVKDQSGQEAKQESESETKDLPEEEIKREEEEEVLPDTYVIGVTRISFNPVIAVYQRMLRNKKGQIVTPQYYNQETDDSRGWYWKHS
ncbi:MAG TPA: hypothetical protein PKC58_10160 [Ignavibacteria bacterium]|nr:hypothetical protein [Ignavibacteria bacterium]